MMPCSYVSFMNEEFEEVRQGRRAEIITEEEGIGSTRETDQHKVREQHRHQLDRRGYVQRSASARVRDQRIHPVLECHQGI